MTIALWVSFSSQGEMRVSDAVRGPSAEQGGFRAHISVPNLTSISADAMCTILLLSIGVS